MSALDGSSLTRLVESVAGVQSERLEQPVPRREGGGGFPHDQGLVDEFPDQWEHRAVCDPATRAHGFGGVDVEGAVEHAQAAEGDLRAGGQELMAPLDGREQAPVTSGLRVRTREHLEPVGYPCCDLGWLEDAYLAGGQLDGEGEAVEPAADGFDVAAVDLGNGEVGTGKPGTVDEQLNRFGVDVEGRHGEDDLAGNIKGLAAGGKDAQRRTVLQQCRRQRCARFDDLFA